MPSLMKRFFSGGSSSSSKDKEKENGDDSSSDEDTRPSYESYVVLEFDEKCPTEVIEWVVAKITSPNTKGGARLLARTALDANDKEVVVHVSASTPRLLIAAELMEMKKPYQDGTLREISVDDISHYKNSEDLDNFLTLAEKQRIVKHEIEIIRALETDEHIAGYPKIKLYKGEAILPKCMKEDIITKMYPLHDKEVLHRLGSEWYKAFFKPQPLEKIQEYFGDTIAMYFAFLGCYTMALIPPTFIGLLSMFTTVHDVSMRIFFCVFNLVWVTLFLEAWKRNSASLAYTWGTINGQKFEEARAAYYGELATNKVTGRLEPRYPKWKRALKFYGVSVPVVLLCLAGAFVMMVFYFQCQGVVDRYHAEHQSGLSSFLTFVPTIIYSVIILVMNIYYKKLGKLLNDWENHRLQSAYENHLITKLVLFEFINSFCALFYVAFYLQDMAMLRRDLGTLLITQQIVNQLLEVVIPYAIYKYKKQGIRKRQKKQSGQEPVCKLSAETVDEEYRNLAEVESTKDIFDEINGNKDSKMKPHLPVGTLQDYLELYLQFGYVFLFSAVFPTAAFWALLNNITEIRSDSFKLCRIFQRPFAQPCSNIGAWMAAFEIMNIMAVISNTVIIAVSPKGQELQEIYGQVTFLVVLVMAEHAVLALKAMIAYLIPDEPEWVQTAVARVEYESKQAWRKQRLAEAKAKFRQRHSPAKTVTAGGES